MANGKLLLLCLVLPAVAAVKRQSALKKDTRLGKKSMFPKRTDCDPIALSQCAVQDPICTKLIFRDEGNRSATVVMVNKCEMGYLRCLPGVDAVIEPMSVCDHAPLRNAAHGKKRSKREAPSSKESPERGIFHMTMLADAQQRQAAAATDAIELEVGDRPENNDGAQIGSDVELGAPDAMDHPDAPYQDPDSDVDYQKPSDDPNASYRDEVRPLPPAPYQEPEDAPAAGEADYDETLYDPNAPYREEVRPLPPAPYQEPEYEAGARGDGEDGDRHAGDTPEVMKYERGQIHVIRLSPPPPAVDESSYQAACPRVCPSRDVGVCARCQHNVHRSFMSVCHMRMFVCSHTDEKLELVSRAPCVQSSPYMSDRLLAPRGRVGEPADDDVVLRFIRCREMNNDSREADNRCMQTLPPSHGG